MVPSAVEFQTVDTDDVEYDAVEFVALQLDVEETDGVDVHVVKS